MLGQLLEIKVRVFYNSWSVTRDIAKICMNWENYTNHFVWFEHDLWWKAIQKKLSEYVVVPTNGARIAQRAEAEPNTEEYRDSSKEITA